jgi:ketosteroid isomerase-like protein
MRGVEAVVAGLFSPLNRDFSEFRTMPLEFVAENDRVVVFGNYGGVARSSGLTMSAPFVHSWTVSNGRTRTFFQYTDSAVWNEPLDSPS